LSAAVAPSKTKHWEAEAATLRDGEAVRFSEWVYFIDTDRYEEFQ
jgi:hypothetical protein